MDNSQTTAGSDSNQYGTTRNPQTPGGDNLSSTATNLQTTTPNLFTGSNNVSITQVGDSSFTPYTPQNATVATVSSTSATVDHHYPVIIGSGLLILVVLIVSWLVIRRQSSY